MERSTGPRGFFKVNISTGRQHAHINTLTAPAGIFKAPTHLLMARRSFTSPLKVKVKVVRVGLCRPPHRLQPLEELMRIDVKKDCCEGATIESKD